MNSKLKNQIKSARPKKLAEDDREQMWGYIASRVGASIEPERTQGGVRSSVPGRSWGLAFVAVFVMVLGVGTVGASDTAKPGDVLFPVDRAAEEFSLFLAGDKRKTELQKAHIDERIAELREVFPVVIDDVHATAPTAVAQIETSAAPMIMSAGIPEATPMTNEGIEVDSSPMSGQEVPEHTPKTRGLPQADTMDVQVSPVSVDMSDDPALNSFSIQTMDAAEPQRDEGEIMSADSRAMRSVDADPGVGVVEMQAMSLSPVDRGEQPEAEQFTEPSVGISRSFAASSTPEANTAQREVEREREMTTEQQEVYSYIESYVQEHANELSREELDSVLGELQMVSGQYGSPDMARGAKHEGSRGSGTQGR